MKKIIFGCVIGLIGLTAAAESNGRGPWHFTAGPAWRARVKMETSGSVATPTVSASSTLTRDSDPDSKSEWSSSDVSTKKDDPNGRNVKLWAVPVTFTEVTETAGGGDAATSGTDEKRPLGVKAKFGYDVWANDAFAVALDLRFAGYWNMRSSCSGRSASALRTTKQGTDYWYFKGGPFPDDPDGSTDFEGFTPEFDANGREYDQASTTTEAFGSTAVRSKLSADLYQIGLGPTVSWRALSWLDAYAGVAALCNIASLDFDAGSRGSSETQCRLGFAGEVGLIGYLTENLGLYGEVGYEWVDGFDASVGSLNADIDFSSLMVSAGVILAF